MNDSRPESEKDKEVGVASTIVDKMKPHQVRVGQSLLCVCVCACACACVCVSVVIYPRAVKVLQQCIHQLGCV